jgi:hypothetical protein
LGGLLKYIYDYLITLNKFCYRISIVSMFVMILSIGLAPSLPFVITFGQNASNSDTPQTTATLEPGGIDLSLLQKIVAKEPEAALQIKMAQLSSSNKTEDIATLAYIWGYSPISMERSFNWFTNPKVPTGPSHGPANTLNCNRELVNANDTDVVMPNADTLYCVGWMDLSDGPLVLKVPAIKDRYYTFEFLDAYTNVYSYVGTRATGSSGGTYLIAGPQWNGEVPNGMTMIWSPTNLAWILQRTLLKGPNDIGNVHAIQDQMSLAPLSGGSQGNTSEQGSAMNVTNASWALYPASFVPTELQQNPVSPKPPFIPTTGIKIFDEIGTAMTGNPLNPAEPALVKKFASIGIGPGMTPSTQANDTVKQALEMAIQEGEKLISAQVPNLGTVVNGWGITSTGLYGTDYLFRAGVTKLGLGANLGQEAIYPPAFTDIEGKQLSGSNKYTIHFKSGQLPPVDAFWSISMYNNESYFVDNPINRYNIGQYTEGLKNNTDGSLDVYVQHDNPGPDKESNWLPAPAPNNDFKVTLRLYLPQEAILNGTWIPPTINRTAG